MRLPSSASTAVSATARSGCASFGAKPELTDRRAGYFTHVDGVNRFALVALDPERPEEVVAVVSFDREGDTDRAEYAAAVEALKRGIRVFTGVVLPENPGCSTCLGTSICQRGCATRRARSSSR